MQQPKNRNVDSMLIKGIIIAVLTILMLIPITLVSLLIDERANNKAEVTQEISSKWGKDQTLTGPVLVLPYTTNVLISSSQKNAEPVYEKRILYAYFTPDLYNVDSEIKVEERKRSIYSTLVYQTENKISGTFSNPKIENLKINAKDVLWKEAFMVIGIPYMQGIKNKIEFNANGKVYEAMPGVNDQSIASSGLTISVPIDAEKEDKKIDFDFRLDLSGSEKLQIAPMGKENNIKMNSDWPTVSFIGDFLPTRNLGKDGFTAEWNIYDYNRNFVQMWTGHNRQEIPTVGVELKYSVDQYQMSMRSVKYAIMFIALTFVIFFFVEIITKKRIHPVQYALVSLALILFYTLLIALSEHISFQLSYLISATAVVVMITLYVKTFFKSIPQTLIMGGFIAGIYIYLYVILQLEDMSLLIGSIGLFVVLAAIMYASRKINWYKDDAPEIEENGRQ